MSTYDNVVRAAQRLVTDETKDTFALADAVLAHVPEQPSGKRNDLGDSRPLGDDLKALADELQIDGVTTPGGDGYSPASLHELRKTAMAWPVDERHPEAAYRTHQEAGSPKTEGGRVLKALAAVARGENPARPRGLQLDAWNKAVERVQTRRKGFPVAANDVRLALKRKPNVPGRTMTKADVKSAIDKGEITPDELVDLAGEEAIAEAHQENRRRQIRKDIAAGEEGMTDEERIEADAALGALYGTADELERASREAEAEWQPTVFIRRLKEGNESYLSAIIHHKRRGLQRGEDERAEARAEIAKGRHLLDLAEMAISGQNISEEDESFLREAGIEV